MNPKAGAQFPPPQNGAVLLSGFREIRKHLHQAGHRQALSKLRVSSSRLLCCYNRRATPHRATTPSGAPRSPGPGPVPPWPVPGPLPLPRPGPRFPHSQAKTWAKPGSVPAVGQAWPSERQQCPQAAQTWTTSFCRLQGARIQKSRPQISSCSPPETQPHPLRPVPSLPALTSGWTHLQL